MNERIDQLVAQWARAGAGFGAGPGGAELDLERMVLETARLTSRMARLMVMSATWLHRYGSLMARHRLARLVRDELETGDRPTLGLLLETAQRGNHPAPFATIIEDLRAAAVAGPLFDVERGALAARARRRASAESMRWGVWCEEIEFKEDALRSPEWVMRQNASFLARADFRGDLRASVMAALAHDAGAGASEMQLARCAGGSRAQVRSALDQLELTGRVRRDRGEGRARTGVRLGGWREAGARDAAA